MDNYYIEQGNAINQKLNEGITILTEDLKNKIDKIYEELEKTNDDSASDHINKCVEMSNKINDEFIVKIIDKIELVKKNADMWQGWYNNLKAIKGNNGYEWAKTNGFNTKEETITINEDTDDKIEAGREDIGGALFNLFNPPKTITKTIYYWTAYTDITIDSNGYMNISINNYKSEDGNTTETSNSTGIVSDEASYNTYYNSRGSVGTLGSSSGSSGNFSGGGGSHGF